MNNGNSEKKKDIFYLVLLLFILLTLIVSITFTMFSLMGKDKEDSTRIETGTLSINYIDGNEIDTYELIPINEPNLNTKYSVYKKMFSVSSDGTLDQNMDIYIDITKNEFSDNALGFILYDDNNKVISKGSIPSKGRVLLASSLYLDSNSKRDFTVLIWLKENGEDQNYEQGHSFSGSFDIVATQIKY